MILNNFFHIGKSIVYELAEVRLDDLQTSFRPAGLEPQKRLANLVPPRRVRSRG